MNLNLYDALLIIDVQNDFLPGGSLAINHGDEIIRPLNKYIHQFQEKKCPIIATRDWHPPQHISFKKQGGIWPDHCVAGTKGAEFSEKLQLPKTAYIISKATTKNTDAYSGFEQTNLKKILNEKKIKRLFIGGLATDYCVLKTVIDARKKGYEVIVLKDAIRAVELSAGDTAAALNEMEKNGAVIYEPAP